MKKIFLYIFLVLMFCNSSNAIPMKGNGQGDLALSDKVMKEFYSYITTRITNNPLNFFITEDHMNVFFEIREGTTYTGYSGSGPIVRNKKKCEQKYKQDCFLFANQRIVVWNNDINPINSKDSKIERKISYEELIVKLNELGFETKKQKTAKEKKLAEEKAAKEKKLAEEKAAKEKKLAEEKAAKEKKLAEEKVAKEKKLAEEKVAKEKKLAEEKVAKEEKLGEKIIKVITETTKNNTEKSLAEEKAAKEKKLAEEKAAKEKIFSDLNKWWKNF